VRDQTVERATPCAKTKHATKQTDANVGNSRTMEERSTAWKGRELVDMSIVVDPACCMLHTVSSSEAGRFSSCKLKLHIMRQ
jgi:hypothetical protein